MMFVLKMLRAAGVVVCVSLLLSASGWAQEEQQSLGDIARQEKAKKPKKVVTDENLPQGTATSGSESTPAAAASNSAKTEEQGESASKEGQESAAAPGEEGTATKAQQAEQAKTELQSLKHDENSFEKGIARLEEKLANETDESRRELYRNAIKHAQELMEKTKQQRAEKEKDVADKEAAAKEEQENQPPPQPPQ